MTEQADGQAWRYVNEGRFAAVYIISPEGDRFDVGDVGDFKRLFDRVTAEHRKAASAAGLEKALREAQTTLIWASGAFQTEELMNAWASVGWPVLESIRAALEQAGQGVGTTRPTCICGDYQPDLTCPIHRIEAPA